MKSLTRDEVIAALRKTLTTRQLGARLTCSTSMLLLYFADALGEEPDTFTYQVVYDITTGRRVSGL